MFPVLLKIGPFSLTSFNLCLGLGILAAIYFFLRFARRAGFNESQILDLSFFSLLAGFLPAKIFGLSGGIVGFSLAAFFYIKKRRWSYLKVGDGLLPAAILGLAFGELGLAFGERFSAFHFLLFLLYLLFSISGFIFLKKEIRTGFIFYFCGGLLFTLFSVSQMAQKRIVTADFFLGLAYLSYFVLGFKNGGYMKNFVYPRELIDRLRQRLVRYRGKIEEEEKQISAEDVLLEGGEASRSAEPTDEASEEIGHSFVQVTLSRLRDLKKQINEALARMRSGKYGLCERCSQPIDKARLEAYPEAALCLKCEQMREERV